MRCLSTAFDVEGTFGEPSCVSILVNCKFVVHSKNILTDLIIGTFAENHIKFNFFAVIRLNPLKCTQHDII